MLRNYPSSRTNAWSVCSVMRMKSPQRKKTMRTTLQPEECAEGKFYFEFKSHECSIIYFFLFNRREVEPEILEGSSEDEEMEDVSMGRVVIPGDVLESEEEDDVNEEELERRRALIRQKLLNKRAQEETEVIMEEDEIKQEESSEESSEYEEYTGTH
jgi:hypothetical protein